MISHSIYIYIYIKILSNNCMLIMNERKKEKIKYKLSPFYLIKFQIKSWFKPHIYIVTCIYALIIYEYTVLIAHVYFN